MAEQKPSIVAFKELIYGEGRSVVYFYADWVAQCRAMKETIRSAAVKAGVERIGYVNVDESKELFVIYKVESVPTVAVFEKGEPIKKIEGYLPEDQLVAQLK